MTETSWTGTLWAQKAAKHALVMERSPDPSGTKPPEQACWGETEAGAPRACEKLTAQARHGSQGQPGACMGCRWDEGTWPPAHEVPAGAQWVMGTEVTVASQTQGEGTGRAVLWQLPAAPKSCPVQAQGMKAFSLHPDATLAGGG